MTRLYDPDSLFDRVILGEGRVKTEQLPNGRCRHTVSTLTGTVLMSFDSATEAEGERHMRDMGPKRIPPYLAHELDILH